MRVPDSPNARVLVVDDELRQMTALCDTLSNHGYETLGFNNAEAALAALREGKFDLILTDLMMPGMDGIALLRAARELDPHLVGIVMTGHGTIDTAVEAMKVGALDYILKPFKLNTALPAIDRAMTIRRLREKNAILEQRVRERTTQLEAANNGLEAFASSIAHELHAPARHIAAYAQMLMNEGAGKPDESATSRLQTIIRIAERMGQLIGDLLAFSRLTRSEIRHRLVDVEALVAQVRRELDSEPSGRTIVWKVGKLPTVEADQSMLRQVLLNLLSNAIKYTRNRAEAEIEMSCEQQGNEFVFSVRDNGAGFDMQYAKKLFVIFQRLHRADQFEGTGVGLSTVHRIIQRHGGRIWAEGEVDRGATFYFTLPVHQADTA